MAAGFECEFVEEPQKAFQSECPICLLILREPHQASCCGKSFCKECVEQVRDKSPCCPACKVEDFHIFHNKGLQQSLYDFRVYCSSKEEGCEWTGELRELDKHLNKDPLAGKSLEGCSYIAINCPLHHAGCEVNLPRKDMKAHLEQKSIQHMLFQVQEQSLLLARIENLHQENQKLQTIIGEIHEEKQYLEQRLTDLEAKLELPTACTCKTPFTQPTGTLELTMGNFESKKRDHVPWFSPPFYTHPQGYKMCLQVNANGLGQGKGTHMSTYIHMMRGEFDDQLMWPFRGHISVQLVDQERESDHFHHTFHFTDAAPLEVRERQRERERSQHGRGPSKFILLTELRPKYLKNDCLRFRITKVELK